MFEEAKNSDKPSPLESPKLLIDCPKANSPDLTIKPLLANPDWDPKYNSMLEFEALLLLVIKKSL